MQSPRPAYPKAQAPWLFGHSDAWHPGSRDECEHCQEMIRAFGPMPSIPELRALREVRAVPARPIFAAKDRWLVWERDDFRCVACGSRQDLTIDHIVPLIQGGSHEIANFQTLCRSCNSRKGGR